MRVSTYEIILSIPESDNSLLVNGLYGALDVVSKETAEHIQNLNFNKIDSPTKGRLISRGHLTEKKP